METTNFEVPAFKTINEIAEITGLAKYHIRKMLFSGKIKYIKAGKKYLIQVASLVEYLRTGDTNTRKEGNK